jgi:5,10-methylenetetrahydromethanopterin reductase
MRIGYFGGTLNGGTITWCTGPKTLGEYIVPTINAAAEAAGRPTPRVVAALPVCVTDEAAATREAVTSLIG